MISREYEMAKDQIALLFEQVFEASEGAAEGQLIRTFVTDLMATPEADLFAFTYWVGDVLAGCIFFSRLIFVQDRRQAFILSPVAVRTDRQRGGVGQHLILFGLDTLRDEGVDFVVTYGDPAYYGKTGFRPISEDFAQAPLKLSHPHGWMGQFLSDRDTAPMRGPSRCVNALNRPELW